jgi:hypothetical protein
MKILLPCMFCLLLSGCFATTGTAFKLKTYEVPEKYQQGEKTPLRDGDIVMSVTSDPMSLVYILNSTEFSRYVHVGVVSIEDGEPYVYEAVGWGLPLPGEVPTDAINGAIYRSRFKDFLWRQRTVEVFAPPPYVDRNKVAAYARTAYENKLPFDPYFDAVNHDKVYCTEFVALALETGGHPGFKLVPRNTNASLSVAIRWLKLDNELTLPADVLVQNAETVAVISHDLEKIEILLWHEIRRELFRRFTPDQRLGYLFKWRGNELEYRQDVQAFIDQALTLKSALPDSAGKAELRKEVQRVAGKLFGPVRWQRDQRLAETVSPAQAPGLQPQKSH